MNDNLDKLKKKALSLPKTPGVYLMKDKNNEIIYVGKAKALKNRVNSYFTAIESHQDKVYRMVMNVYDFDYILTDSEFEALVLECSLIKLHNPKYNILLKDDKGYHYIKITNEPYRRIKEAKQKLDDDATYIGPYTSMYALSEAVKEVTDIFKLPTCNIKLTGEKVRKRPCLNYYINKCKAPCLGNIDVKDYNEAVDEALKFLRGDAKQYIAELKTQMEKCANELKFEKAAEIRDRIKSIQKLQDKQKIVATRLKNQDVIAFAKGQKYGCFVVMKFREHKLIDKEQFIIKAVSDDSEARAEFIKRYYELRSNIPSNIFMDKQVDDIETIELWLQSKASKKVSVLVPKKGEQLKLIEMCRKNAYEMLAQKEGRMSGKESEILAELAEMLSLDKVPNYIEAYDISNLRGDDNVAGMIVFENGKPLKKAYKRFKIKGIIGQDDYGSMREVIRRRFNEYQTGEDVGFSTLPDLILLDGGKTHVAVVKELLKEIGIEVPVFGMVKDSRHRTRAIARDGAEVEIKSNHRVFNLITRIQDEVHRFAVNYHHKSKSKNTFDSNLMKIEGIGKAKAGNLIKEFRTINRVKDATKEELCKVRGISEKNAKNIIDFFN